MRSVLALLVLAVLVVVRGAAVETAAAQSVPADAITFTKHVAPILQNRCQGCHRPNTFAPMSLMTHEEVRPWARAIKVKVVGRQMPPWFIDKTVGVQEFENDTSLSDAEIATIVKWVDAGAPKGNQADMPPPRTFVDDNRWQFGRYGEPDIVVSLPDDYILPGSGPDHWPTILVDPKLTEDRYIAGVQVVPTKGYTSIHHIRTALLPPNGGEAQAEEQGEEMGAFLNEYAIGKGADLFVEDAARLIQAGSKIAVTLHLHPVFRAQGAKDTPVNIAVGLKLHPKGYRPRYVALTDKVPYGGVDIRPGEPNARVDGYYHLYEPTKLLSWQPHMHNRGKYACIVALIPPAPDDKSVGIAGLRSQRHELRPLSCAHFSFSWHLNYVYADDSAPLLPAGTILQTMQWHDNSSANKNNTDPDAQVTRGDRTIDEMAGAWISFHHMSEAEFKKALADRKARSQPTVLTTR